MRRITAATCAALATMAMTIAAPATQASAANNHSVNVSGTMVITDDENWPYSNEVRRVNFNHSFVVGTNITQASWTASGCAGGEVRIEATFTVVHLNNLADSVRVIPDIRMYEGTSCSSGDHDGTAVTNSFTVLPNATATRSYVVHNTSEGGDRADVTFTVANQV